MYIYIKCISIDLINKVKSSWSNALQWSITRTLYVHRKSKLKCVFYISRFLVTVRELKYDTSTAKPQLAYFGIFNPQIKINLKIKLKKEDEWLFVYNYFYLSKCTAWFWLNKLTPKSPAVCFWITKAPTWTSCSSCSCVRFICLFFCYWKWSWELLESGNTAQHILLVFTLTSIGHLHQGSSCSLCIAHYAQVPTCIFWSNCWNS